MHRIIYTKIQLFHDVHIFFTIINCYRIDIKNIFIKYGSSDIWFIKSKEIINNWKETQSITNGNRKEKYLLTPQITSPSGKLLASVQINFFQLMILTTWKMHTPLYQNFNLNDSIFMTCDNIIILRKVIKAFLSPLERKLNISCSWWNLH